MLTFVYSLVCGCDMFLYADEELSIRYADDIESLAHKDSAVVAPPCRDVPSIIENRHIRQERASQTAANVVTLPACFSQSLGHSPVNKQAMGRGLEVKQDPLQTTNGPEDILCMSSTVQSHRPPGAEYVPYPLLTS